MILKFKTTGHETGAISRAIPRASCALFALFCLIPGGLTTGVFARDAALDEQSARQFLQNLVGTWYGEYRIRTPDARTLNQIDVEEHYTWEEKDGEMSLHGRAVMHTSGRMTYSTSRTWIKNGQLHSRVQVEERTRDYLGELSTEGNEVSWRPAAGGIGNRMNQTITREDNRDVLIVSGYEDYRQGDSGTLLMIHAKLYRQP